MKLQIRLICIFFLIQEADESELMFQLFHPKQPPIVFQAETAALAKK